MSRDVRAAIERVARLDGVARIAVMPDVHLAVGGCVGMVVATSRRILPQAVGGDIGCGMLAIATDVGADALACPDRSGALLNRLRTAVPAMRHRDLASAPALDGLQPSLLSTASLAKRAEREGRIELGSLGRGNHFLEFQRDEEGRLWLMIHSGSRCMGQAISGAHDANAERAAGGLRCLDAATPAGQAYLNDVAWARAYAAENRRLIANAAGAVLNELIGAALLPETRIECDHNHVRIEAHFGRELLLHRKGAAPAAEGEPGVIPGSMGTESFHTIGRGCADALRSSSHGAGRALTRTEARRRVSPERLERQLGDVAFDTRLADRLCEEAPSAYKDIGGVMRAQRELTRISRRLRPVLVYKGV
ncbi:MAG: RtcB family protein [Phycisphaerales bacterium]|nr:RtcB family protein [Phycisphaerales bacterium]